MPSSVIVDSGPLIAGADRSDRWHSEVVQQFRGIRPEDLVVPALCIGEAAYLLQARLGARAEARFIEGLVALNVEAPTPEDLVRMAEVMRQYQDMPLGATDASIVALAERLAAPTLFTLDRRHFGAIRPRHRETLELLP